MGFVGPNVLYFLDRFEFCRATRSLLRENSGLPASLWGSFYTADLGRWVSPAQSILSLLSSGHESFLLTAITHVPA